MTKDRSARLEATLRRLCALPDPVSIIVVDNGSSDGTPDMVRRAFPEVRLVPLSVNRLARARDVGVALAGTELVAFSDDDSWWQPGSLTAVEQIFARSPRLGLVAARIVVEPSGGMDPTCRLMEESPLGPDEWGRPRILGFLACGAVVRRSAFLDVGGFDDLLGFVGEEAALALDLAARGWGLVYAPEVVAVHEPSDGGRDTARRRRMEVRNRLLSAIVRRRQVVQIWMDATKRSRSDPDVRAALKLAMRRAPAALVRRRCIPAGVEADLRLLQGFAR